MDQFNSLLDQSDHEHLYHTPAHTAHKDFVNPERSEQKKIFCLGTPGAVEKKVTLLLFVKRAEAPKKKEIYKTFKKTS